MINDLNKYKQSKRIVKDLTELMFLTSEAISKFNKYNKYVPVKDILSTLKENHLLLSLHLDKHKKIVSTKGQIND